LALKQTIERELLDEHEAADCLGLSLSTLRRYRYGIGGRHGLPVIKIGRAVRYARSDLNRFAGAQRVPALRIAPNTKASCHINERLNARAGAGGNLDRPNRGH
jgi:hypothetical protein